MSPPFRRFDRDRDFPHRFPRPFYDPVAEINEAVSRMGAAWGDGTDVEETEDAFVVEIEVPGMKPEDMTIDCHENQLWVRGEVVERERSGTLHQQSRRYGRFEHKMTLPGPVDTEKAEATLAHGLLTIRLPKAATTTHHRIPVTPA